MKEKLIAFEPGTIVSTKPAKGYKWVLNSVLELDAENNFIEVGLMKEYADNLLTLGEEMEIASILDNFFYNAKGTVLEFILSYPQKIKIRINSINKVENKREEARYEVNMYSIIKGEEVQIPETSIITDISKSGIGLISKQNLSIGSEVFIDIYLDAKNILKVKGKVIRKRASGYDIEYGMSISPLDKENKEILKNELTKLENKGKNAVSVIKKIRGQI